MCILQKTPGKGDETHGPAKPKPLIEIHSLRNGEKRLRLLYPKACIIRQMLAKNARAPRAEVKGKVRHAAN